MEVPQTIICFAQSIAINQFVILFLGTWQLLLGSDASGRAHACTDALEWLRNSRLTGEQEPNVIRCSLKALRQTSVTNVQVNTGRVQTPRPHTHTHKVLQKPFTRCGTAFFCCCKLHSIKCYLLWAAWLLPCTLHKPEPVSLPQHPTYYHVSVSLPAFTDARHERSARFQTNDRNQWSDIYRNEAGEQMNLIRLLPSRQLRNWVTSGYVCVSKEGIKTFVKQPSALSDLAIVFDSMAGIKTKACIFFLLDLDSDFLDCHCTKNNTDVMDLS